MKFPKVEKRTFTIPKFLKYDWKSNPHYYPHDKYEEEYPSKVIETRKINTKKKVGAVEIRDVFYREIGTEEWKYGYSRKSQQMQTKFLCIGGPKDGEMHSIAPREDYVPYNNAGSGVSCVLIHKDLLAKAE